MEKSKDSPVGKGSENSRVFYAGEQNGHQTGFIKKVKVGAGIANMRRC